MKRALFGIMAVIWGFSLPVAAYEGNWTLEPGIAGAYVKDATLSGATSVGGGLAASYGLNDIWTLKGYAHYLASLDNNTKGFGVGGVELLYTVDIAVLVPYAGAGVSAAVDVAGHAYAGPHATMGLDWLIDWDHALGLDVRYAFMPLTDAKHDRMLLTVGAHWAWFF